MNDTERKTKELDPMIEAILTAFGVDIEKADIQIKSIDLSKDPKAATKLLVEMLANNAEISKHTSETDDKNKTASIKELCDAGVPISEIARRNEVSEQSIKYAMEKDDAQHMEQLFEESDLPTYILPARIEYNAYFAIKAATLRDAMEAFSTRMQEANEPPAYVKLDPEHMELVTNPIDIGILNIAYKDGDLTKDDITPMGAIRTVKKD